MNAMEMLGVVAAPEETPAQTAIRAAFKLGQERMRERCAEVCDEMVDWPIEKHPCATITDSYPYLLGIQRGLVNATNAIRELPVEE